MVSEHIAFNTNFIDAASSSSLPLFVVYFCMELSRDQIAIPFKRSQAIADPPLHQKKEYR